MGKQSQGRREIMEVRLPAFRQVSAAAVAAAAAVNPKILNSEP
jgi:hypothetical protein